MNLRPEVALRSIALLGLVGSLGTACRVPESQRSLPISTPTLEIPVKKPGIIEIKPETGLSHKYGDIYNASNYALDFNKEDFYKIMEVSRQGIFSKADYPVVMVMLNGEPLTEVDKQTILRNIQTIAMASSLIKRNDPQSEARIYDAARYEFVRIDLLRLNDANIAEDIIRKYL